MGHLCFPTSGTVRPPGKMPSCSPLLQAHCTPALSNISCVRLLVYHQSLTPQMAAIKQYTEQMFPLSFTIPVPVTTGEHLEGGHRGHSHLVARTTWPAQPPTDQAPINCWRALDRLMERTSSRLVSSELNTVYFSVWGRAQQTGEPDPNENTHGHILSQYQWNPAVVAPIVAPRFCCSSDPFWDKTQQ